MAYDAQHTSLEEIRSIAFRLREALGRHLDAYTRDDLSDHLDDFLTDLDWHQKRVAEEAAEADAVDWAREHSTMNHAQQGL